MLEISALRQLRPWQSEMVYVCRHSIFDRKNIMDRRDGSSLFIIFVLALLLMIGAAWVYSRYRINCDAPSTTIGCGITPLP